MSEFKKEFRYLVFKIKDVDLYLTEQEKDSLLCIADELAVCRADAGKNPLQCVVVEDDWPEYETVWNMIRDRTEGKQTKLEVLRARVAGLEKSLDKVHRWLVCAPIATAEDMAQSFPEMEEETRRALATLVGEDA